MKLPALLGTLLCAAVLIPASASTAQAEITRHCTGYIGPTIIAGIDSRGRQFTIGFQKSRAGVFLGGRGTCRGKAWANDCRRRARDAVIACARELWRTRRSRRVPTNACGSAYTSRPPHGYITQWGSPPRSVLRGNVKGAVQHAACCVLFPQARELTFSVYLSVVGDTRCNHYSTLESRSKANCHTLRAKGLCGAPQRGR